ncbi:helix-turn-helix transcriptional regulator [Streptomyces sp. MUM 136J]|uniref:helix-turn-helix domain-containing protein n=1 Tax=Streptomyces sp. MUM 136J TaxID=2791992 RepID=UPI001F03420D|nr:helix-turn-helix transcriptional regulator [Streptomyces sp. MUM 136J]MCH0570753.1 helix-turn-helix transcriptional regulator [Streptomyces sp. MUM 136J]
MAARTSPTERQKRLGAELRKMRTAAGMTGEHAAGLLGVDRGKISNIESGARAISAERLRTLARNCGCEDEAYVDTLVGMARPARDGWWERYRGSLPAGLLDIAELEHHAVRIRSVHFVHMPGLLQSSDHAQAVFKAALPPLPEHEVALRLAHRLERQRVLEGDEPTAYVGIVHEAALRMRFGGRKVARGQLEHLLSTARRPHVTVRVIPFDAGSFPGAGQTVVHAEGPMPRLDTVQTDSAHGPEFLHQEAQLSKYRAQLDCLEQRALSAEESHDFIQDIASRL